MTVHLPPCGETTRLLRVIARLGQYNRHNAELLTLEVGKLAKRLPAPGAPRKQGRNKISIGSIEAFTGNVAKYLEFLGSVNFEDAGSDQHQLYQDVRLGKEPVPSHLPAEVQARLDPMKPNSLGTCLGSIHSFAVGVYGKQRANIDAPSPPGNFFQYPMKAQIRSWEEVNGLLELIPAGRVRLKHRGIHVCLSGTGLAAVDIVGLRWSQFRRRTYGSVLTDEYYFALPLLPGEPGTHHKIPIHHGADILVQLRREDARGRDLVELAKQGRDFIFFSTHTQDANSADYIAATVVEWQAGQTAKGAKPITAEEIRVTYLAHLVAQKKRSLARHVSYQKTNSLIKRIQDQVDLIEDRRSLAYRAPTVQELPNCRTCLVCGHKGTPIGRNGCEDCLRAWPDHVPSQRELQQADIVNRILALLNLQEGLRNPTQPCTPM